MDELGKKVIFANIQNKGILGDQHERWLSKKEELGLTHAGLAKILLDRFAGIFFFYTSIVYVNFQDYNYFKRNKQ